MRTEVQAWLTMMDILPIERRQERLVQLPAGRVRRAVPLVFDLGHPVQHFGRHAVLGCHRREETGRLQGMADLVFEQIEEVAPVDQAFENHARLLHSSFL